MGKHPLVSIIIPVYNVERYLRRCLDSILLQTYYNLEIILVDDGSTDSSGEICDEYAEKDSRISVIHKENGGLSDARNAGIEAASADYIAFIDSDDYVEKQYVQRLAGILLKNNADIAICGYYCGKREKFPEIKRYHRKIQCFDSKVMLKNWHGKYKHVETAAWNKLYKKVLFVENNIYYPVGYIYEDVQTTHLLVNKALKIVLTNEKLYYYYHRKDSIMQTISEEKMKACIYAQNKRLKFFKDNGYREAYERLAVKRQKQYMLNYLNSVMVKDMEKTKAEMLSLYNESYKRVCSFDEIRIWERLLFFMFRYFHDFIWILARKRRYN